MHQNSSAQLHVDAQGIATITLKMAGRVNKINAAFGADLHAAITQVMADDSVIGVIIASGHRDFCVGADIEMLHQVHDPAQMMTMVHDLNSTFRLLETGGKPVVAALTGSALGGGYELAMACHHRIALNDGRIQLGLPEVKLGVIPGAGGTQRLPRMIGIQAALELMSQGRLLRAPKALQKGLVDALADTPAELFAQATDWIVQHPSAQQPWDQGTSMRWVGPDPSSREAHNLFVAGCALLYKKTAGAYPAPQVLMDVVKQGSALTFDRAVEVESRAFVHLATSATAQDMQRTVWFHRQAAERCEGLPSTDHGIKRVAIVGAGMMGAGLAAICAQRGFTVVVKDISETALTKAQHHCAAYFAKKRHLTDAQRQQYSAQITFTTEDAPVDGCDLLIEAVVENTAVKHAVMQQLEPRLAAGGIWATNTSALPIATLSAPSTQPGNVIGLHFFSPVEQMPLLEIVVGPNTTEDTLARCVRLARDLGKLPIVVNDGYGFYTTRVFSAYLLEGVQLICEGHDPAVVEWAARSQGMAVGPLKAFDEVSLTLASHAFSQAVDFRPLDPDLTAPEFVLRMINEFNRNGKAHGAGFYRYDGPRQIWPALQQHAAGERRPTETGVDVVGRRLLLAQVAEAARCLDEGIVTTPRDADLGAVFGLGFAPNTGGPFSWVDRQGVASVVDALHALARRHGERFRPAPVLIDMAKRSARFYTQ